MYYYYYFHTRTPMHSFKIIIYYILMENWGYYIWSLQDLGILKKNLYFSVIYCEAREKGKEL